MVEGVIVNFHSDLQRPFLKNSNKTEIECHPTGYEKKSQHTTGSQRKPENEICSATTYAENPPLKIQPHNQSRTEKFPKTFYLSFRCGPRRFIIKELLTVGLNF